MTLSPTNSGRLQEKFRRIRLLAMDVDGVLTDGRITYGDAGIETKTFHVHDGLGIRLLLHHGIRVCVVTGRRSEALQRRCRELGIDAVFDGVSDKAAVMDEIRSRWQLAEEDIACMGDDLPDMAMMEQAGLRIAVADAREPVKSMADVVTRSAGGKGAVREICDRILKSQGKWEEAMQRFRWKQT
ncbi:MAG: HAD hydrolase family protein [Desulfobacteraceae bacterium]|jgi:3-deoxy-D-manno-octulosonate 8-phosphate phosphatase (KDO 8-P phosphatase)|nr:HAD hydrolase family protein [Desulfobacteraceae bacterium]